MKRVLLFSVTFLAALGPHLSASADTSEIRIASYGGAFTEAHRQCVGDLFTSKYHVNVVWIDGNPTGHLAKLLAARQLPSPPFDLVYTDDGPFVQGVTTGVFEKIDPAIVTNLNDVYPIARRNGDLGVTTNVGTIGIAYNEKIFKEHNIAPPKTWADLWNPEFAGHIAMPDITMSSGQSLIVAAAWLGGGNEAKTSGAFEKLAEIRPLYYYTSSADLKAKFLSGDAWIAPWYNGRAQLMIDSGFPMRYFLPENPPTNQTAGFASLTILSVVNGTPARKEANEYIKVALSPEAQVCVSKHEPYAPTNEKAAAMVANDPALAKDLPSDAAVRKIYVPDWLTINKNYSTWLRNWNEVVVH